MLSPVIYLMMNGLFFTLRLSGGGGSFPRPLKAAEEKEYLERCAQGDLEARYTSGGERRKQEVPRYTQVGNAVPPLFAEQIGLAILEVLSNDKNE